MSPGLPIKLPLWKGVMTKTEGNRTGGTEKQKTNTEKES